MTALTPQTEDLLAELAAARREGQNLTERLSTAQADVRWLSQELQQAQAALAQARAQAEDLAAANAALTDERAALQTELTQQRSLRQAQAEAQAQELSQLREHADAQARQHAQRYAQFKAQAEVQYRQDAQDRAALSEQAAALTQQVTRLRVALQAALDETNLTRAALARVEAERTGWIASLEALRRQLLTSEQRVADQFARAEQNAAERLAALEAQAAAQQTAARLQAALNEHARLLQETQIERDHWQAETAALHDLLLEHEQRVAALQAEAAAQAMQARTEPAEREVERAVLAAEPAERERAHQQALEAARLEAADLRRRLAEAVAGQAEVQATLAAAQADWQAERAALAASLARPEQADLAALQTAEQATEALRRQLMAVRAELDEARAAYVVTLAEGEAEVAQAPTGLAEAQAAWEAEHHLTQESATAVPSEPLAAASTSPLLVLERSGPNPFPETNARERPAPSPADVHRVVAADQPPAPNGHTTASAGEQRAVASREVDDGWLGSTREGCPHLGLAHDAATRHAFASELNCCYAHGSSMSVSLVHQHHYCLGAPDRCPVFSGELKQPRVPIDTDREERDRRRGGLRRLVPFVGRGKGENAT